MKPIILMIITYLFSSCVDGTTNLYSKIDGTLIAEKVYIGEDLAPDFFLLESDYLFIASSKKDTMVDVFSIPDLQHIISFACKGQGPDEMTFFPMFCRSSDDNKINIWGYNHILVRSFYMEKGKLKLNREWNMPKYEAFNQMHIVKDSLLVYFVPESGTTVKKIDYKKGKTLDELVIPENNTNGTCFDLSKGNISVNNDYLVYAYCLKDQIELYSLKDFNLIKRIRNDLKDQKVAFGDFESLMQYFTSIFAGRKYIYGLYHGDFFTSNTSCSLIVFNYDLKPVKILKLDYKPILVEIDEVNEVLYGYDPIMEDYILKYTFQSLLDKS